MEDPGAHGEQRTRDDGTAVAKRLALFVALTVVIVFFVWWLWPRFAPVPNIVGMTEENARAAIDKGGFRVGIVATRTVDTTEAGRVVDQLPPPGMRLSVGSVVDYTISEPSGVASGEASGRPPAEEDVAARGGVIVPGVVGRAVADAQNRLQLYGLAVRLAFSASGEADGEVIHQFPNAGVSVAPGSVVDLTVSSGTQGRGSASVSFSGSHVPEVVGLGLGAAKDKLASAGYGMRVVYAPSTSADKGVVFWQSAGAGPVKARPGTVEIWISTGEPTGGAPYPKPDDMKPFAGVAQ